jgi:SPX domain protein involved in polyphosphate accumulation
MADNSDSSANRFRHETKLPLQRQQYQEFRSAFIGMGLHPRKMYTDRRVHSIYLDTPEFNDYYDGVSGLSRRSKIRFRWYQEDTERMVLEVKRKKNKIATKYLFQMRNPGGLIPRDQRLLQSLIMENSEQFPVGIAALYRPVLETNYRRSYFELEPGIRMTIDQQIQYRKLSPTPSCRAKRSPVDYVVEFKYPVGKETEFSHLLRDLPFRIFRHSKYVVGMDTVTVG